ncbi:MAG: HDOD domain-containing protein [Planctomycetes bacterium]|nr:HDOD domain-containing protein [Planctomycetota bacterium]
MTVDTATPRDTVIAKGISLVGELSTLPEVTVRIIEIVEDSRSTARDLHEIIKHDPALSAKVLKVVNSAFYGLPGQVASVDRAIILLGLSAIKNIAIAASIARLFKGGQLSDEFSAKDLWKHSVAVGVCARLISKASGTVAGRDEIFLAGLIHDLGLLVERQAFSKQLAEVIERTKAGEGSFIEMENLVIGADHQGFGEALTTKWKFPRHLRATIGFHHNPDALSQELRKLGCLIRAADIICCSEQIGFYLTAAGEELTPELIETAGITQADVDVIRGQLAEEVAAAETTLAGE